MSPKIYIDQKIYIQKGHWNYSHIRDVNVPSWKN